MAAAVDGEPQRGRRGSCADGRRAAAVRRAGRTDGNTGTGTRRTGSGCVRSDPAAVSARLPLWARVASTRWRRTDVSCAEGDARSHLRDFCFVSLLILLVSFPGVCIGNGDVSGGVRGGGFSDLCCLENVPAFPRTCPYLSLSSVRGRGAADSSGKGGHTCSCPRRGTTVGRTWPASCPWATLRPWGGHRSRRAPGIWPSVSDRSSPTISSWFGREV